jgi:hypothetical protein
MTNTRMTLCSLLNELVAVGDCLNQPEQNNTINFTPPEHFTLSPLYSDLSNLSETTISTPLSTEADSKEEVESIISQAVMASGTQSRTRVQLAQLQVHLMSSTANQLTNTSMLMSLTTAPTALGSNLILPMQIQTQPITVPPAPAQIVLTIQVPTPLNVLTQAPAPQAQPPLAQVPMPQVQAQAPAPLIQINLPMLVNS